MADNFQLVSGAFHSGSAIPAQYTCEGAGTSPPLSWRNPPEGTRSFALIADDPDAPTKTFVHWVLFNLPTDRDTLPPDLDAEDHFDGADPKPVEGVNDYGDLGYGPPCPPPGDGVHRYFFRLYALDTILDLGEGATKQQLTDAMAGHILGEDDLIGTFERGG